MKRYLAINQCPVHKFWSITLDDESGGIRLTPSKCCGRWDTIKQFSMSITDLREVITACENAIDDMERDQDRENAE
jgi:hypothetical protein